MATSKFPIGFVPVPEKIIELSNSNPAVFCNLRPKQRPQPKTEKEKAEERIFSYLDSYMVNAPVIDFLRQITGKTRAVILFQGYSVKDVGTAVVDIDSVYWTDENYPRLDFQHPAAMERIHGCPNFWGSFILAIAKVNPETEEIAGRDKSLRKFVRIAKDSAVSP